MIILLFPFVHCVWVIVFVNTALCIVLSVYVLFCVCCVLYYNVLYCIVYCITTATGYIPTCS